MERLSIKVEEKKNTLLDLYKCYQGAKEIGNLVECLKNMDSELINQVRIKYFKVGCMFLRKIICCLKFRFTLYQLAASWIP